MGRTRENKAAIVAELKTLLGQSQLVLVVDYQGLSVAEITDLRNRLYESDTLCKVTKNTLMGLAIKEDATWEPLETFLKGTNAFLLIGEDMPKAIKAYQEFQKATKKTELRGGVMEGQVLNEAQIKALTELPTKEELYARIAGSIKAIPTKFAVASKQVPTKLVVGINQVPSKLVRALDAMAKKEDEAA
jgi:large subunit ribosomal protein L10